MRDFDVHVGWRGGFGCACVAVVPCFLFLVSWVVLVLLSVINDRGVLLLSIFCGAPRFSAAAAFFSRVYSCPRWCVRPADAPHPPPTISPGPYAVQFCQEDNYRKLSDAKPGAGTNQFVKSVRLPVKRGAAAAAAEGGTCSVCRCVVFGGLREMVVFLQPQQRTTNNNSTSRLSVNNI